ncbi:MAG: hypothetical protein V7717_10600 [Porticoccaceae bacterium]
MSKLIWIFIVVTVAGLGGGYFNRTHCLSDAGPKTAVQSYLSAMKDERFEDAFQFVTASMTDGKPVAEWAEQQSKMFKMGRVVINDIDVRRGHRELKNVFMCAANATVPNVLRASDVLNRQGSTEFEVYKVIMDGDEWRIDSQETLFDDATIGQWFPDDTIPDF